MEELELPAHLRWREADEVKSILIRSEAEHGDAITPIAVRLPHIGNAAHDLEGLLSDMCLFVCVRRTTLNWWRRLIFKDTNYRDIRETID